ncbi:MAG TPA: VWA domain-containing protein [Bryobacteraceae bacterium]
MRTLLACLALTGLLAAQEPSKAPSGDEAFRIPAVTVQVVQAPVTVLDSDGKLVSDLTALDFRLSDNGKPQKITMDLGEHPVSVVVAVQASLNMEKVLPQIRKVGSVFDSMVAGETGEVAVVAFDHRNQVLTPFTSDPEMIHQAFLKLKAGSSTSALNDAVMEGVNMLHNRPKDHRKVLIVISESRDNGSHIHVRDVLTNAEFNDVVIYPLDVSHLVTSLTGKVQAARPNTIPPGGQVLPGGTVMTPTLDLQMNQNGNFVPVITEIFTQIKAIFVSNPLEVYSRYTGGREFPFFTQKGLEEAVADIGKQLHSVYMLTYTPNNQDEAGFHTIKVFVDRHGSDLKVTSRDGYWWAGKQQQP